MEPDAADEKRSSSGDGSAPLDEAEEKAGAEQQEKAGGVEEKEEKGEVKEEPEVKVAAEEKRRRGRKKGNAVGEEGAAKKGRKRKRSAPVEAGTPLGRPSRDRKAVERYSVESPRSASAKKSVSIVQGSGTKLKDIPNVSFKLSKWKVDEILQGLHRLLFGRKSNAHYLKRNIYQFSGFVWTENEEKQKARVKEKLDKCNKEKLLAFCELLDIHVNRTTTKKEEISAKLLEFLESPYATRDVVLAETAEKGKKRGRRRKETSQATPDKEAKKQRKNHRQSTEPEKENDDEVGPDGLEDASMGEENGEDLEKENDHVENTEENGKDEPEEPPRKRVSIEKQAQNGVGSRVKEKISSDSTAAAEKSVKRPKVVKKKAAAEDEPNSESESKPDTYQKKLSKTTENSPKEKEARVKKDTNKYNKEVSESSHRKTVPQGVSRSRKADEKERQNKNVAIRNNNASKKNGAKVEAKSSIKSRGKGKANVGTKGPSTEELHAVVSDILKEVDFNTATLADILRQLGAHFKMDLMDRKAEVKRIIEEVINNMSDDDTGEDEDTEGDSDGEGNK